MSAELAKLSTPRKNLLEAGNCFSRLSFQLQSINLWFNLMSSPHDLQSDNNIEQSCLKRSCDISHVLNHHYPLQVHSLSHRLGNRNRKENFLITSQVNNNTNQRLCQSIVRQILQMISLCETFVHFQWVARVEQSIPAGNEFPNRQIKKLVSVHSPLSFRLKLAASEKIVAKASCFEWNANFRKNSKTFFFLLSSFYNYLFTEMSTTEMSQRIQQLQACNSSVSAKPALELFIKQYFFTFTATRSHNNYSWAVKFA